MGAKLYSMLGYWEIGILALRFSFMNLNLTKLFRFRGYFITYVLYRLFILSSDFSFWMPPLL